MAGVHVVELDPQLEVRLNDRQFERHALRASSAR
jgi:hypothetical protein